LGEETSDEAEAATDEQGNPVPNTLRDVWVTATSLTTSLNTAFLAERIALFSIVMGVALLLTGIGFLVLTIAVLRAGTEPAQTDVGTAAL
jgi:multisubunit Na+/H+ antiporter MnhC subunit